MSKALTAKAFLDAEQLPFDASLEGAELQTVFGRYRDLQRQLQQLQSEQTQYEAVSEVFTDIQAELQEARNTSEMLRKTIVDVALDAVVTVNDDGTIVEFNSSAERIFGYSRDQVIGQPMAEMIIPVHLRDRHHQGMQRYLDSGESRILNQRVEIEGMRADGQNFPVELTVSEVRFGSQHMFTAYLRDISEIKQAEQEISRQREELYQREKLSALGSLLAGISHELNNPLSVVVGRSILMEMDVNDPGLLDSVKEVREAAERCARIVKTFLAMARQQPPERGTAQLNEIIRSALKLTDYSLRTAGIEVTLDLQKNLPAISADIDQINQVFANLLVNAQQALLECPEPRCLTIKTGYDQDQQQLIAEVSDNGPGVEESIRTRIFDPFFTTKPMGAGTGVGLSLSHGVIAAHGGELSHRETEQGGACFVITLPVHIDDQSLEHEYQQTGDAAPVLTVLIVDDEPEVADIISEILRRSGHQTELANSGNSALALLQQHSYDIILSDLHMPDLNGQDFFRRLQTDYPAMSERIAFITGDALSAMVQRFLKESGRPCLEKPFTPKELLELVGAIKPQ